MEKIKLTVSIFGSTLETATYELLNDGTFELIERAGNSPLTTFFEALDNNCNDAELAYNDGVELLNEIDERYELSMYYLN